MSSAGAKRPRQTTYVGEDDPYASRTYAARNKRGSRGGKYARNRLNKAALRLPSALRSAYVAFEKPEMKARTNSSVVDLENTMTSGHLVLLNGILQGLDQNQREGRQAIMQSVNINMCFYKNTTLLNANVAANKCRVLVFWDAQPNGLSISAATYASMLLGLGSPQYLGAAPTPEWKRRLTVLYDKVVVFGPFKEDDAEDQYDDQHGVQILRMNKKLNLLTQYSSTGLDIASVGTGALFMLFVPTNAAGQTLVDYSAQVLFTG